MGTKTRAALYLRISKDDAQTGLAVERQREECVRIIEREDFDLVETYKDNGVSAYSRNVKRPEFDRMTEDYESGRFDVVVVWDMDRFSRQPAQLEHWIELGETRGLRIYTPTEVTDLSTDNGRMFARMKATIARAEVERKSARQRAQVAQAKANGTFKGRIGFDDSDVIRRIFASLLGGTGPYQIAKTLNAEGRTTVPGNPWSGQAVRRVAMSARHRGSLIPESEFDAVQAIVKSGQRVGAKAKGRYSGVARCVTCDAAMTASGDRYVCSWATNHPGEHGHMTVPRKALDTVLDAALTDALVSGAFSLEEDPASATLASVQAQLGQVIRDKEETAENRRKYNLSWSAVAPDLDRLDKEERRLTAQRDRILAQSTHAAILAGIVTDTLGDDGVRLLAMPPTEARGTVLLRVNMLDGDKRRDLARGLLDVRIVAGRGAERVKVKRRTKAKSAA